jgi:AcrR family transcriptional regulator
LAVRSTRRAGSGSRQWSSTEHTRRVFLDAARAVFAEHGFTDASVSEVVERADLSVGSLYHHFGGKSELFLELWNDHTAAQQELTAAAVAAARADGVTDRFELFLAGSRAYLEATWTRRDLVALFQDGDAPPSFGAVQRRTSREWIRGNFTLLRAEDDPVHRVIVHLLTDVLGEARREIAGARSAREAAAMVEDMMALLARMRPIVLDEP